MSVEHWLQSSANVDEQSTGRPEPKEFLRICCGIAFLSPRGFQIHQQVKHAERDETASVAGSDSTRRRDAGTPLPPGYAAAIVGPRTAAGAGSSREKNGRPLKPQAVLKLSQFVKPAPARQLDEDDGIEGRDSPKGVERIIPSPTGTSKPKTRLEELLETPVIPAHSPLLNSQLQESSNTSEEPEDPLAGCDPTNELSSPNVDEEEDADSSFLDIPQIDSVRSLMSMKPEDLRNTSEDIDIDMEDPRVEDDFENSVVSGAEGTVLDAETSGEYDEFEDEEDDEEFAGETFNNWETEEVELFGDAEYLHSQKQTEDSISTSGDNFSRLVSPRLECPAAGCAFKTHAEKFLESHIKRGHNPHHMYPCSQCVCRYESQKELTRHLQMYHHLYGSSKPAEIVKIVVNGKRMLRCKACGYTRRGMHPMNVHVHSAHVPNGPYPCSLCVCRYAKKNQLTQHMACHERGSFITTGNGPEIPIQQRPAASGVNLESATVAAPPKFLFQDFPTAGAFRKRCSYITESTERIPDGKVTTVVLEDDDGKSYRFKKTENSTTSECLFMCMLCDYSSKKVVAISNHMRGAHVPNSQYPCTLCPRAYGNENTLLNHMKRDHPHQNSAPTPTPEETFKPGPQVFSSVLDRLFIHPVRGPLTFSELYRPVNVNGKQLFRCEACGYQCRDRTTTENHCEHVHGPQAAFACEYCSFRYHKRHSLAMHIAKKHPDSSLLLTDPRSNDDSDMMILAYEKLNGGIRMYKCRHCLRPFSEEVQCRDHVMKSHNPESTYLCSYCTCRFQTFSQLSIHEKNYHRETNESSAEPESPRSRRRSSSFSEISMGKSPAKPLAVFPTPKTALVTPLKSEMFTQRNDGVLVCNHCSYTSANRIVLEFHYKASHNPAHPFKCPYCTCRYNNDNSLTAHISSMHDLTMPVLSPAASPPPPPSTETLANVPNAGIEEVDGSVVYYNGFTKTTKGKGLAEYKCSASGCNYLTSNCSAIRNHVKGAHDPSRPMACHLCTSRFTSQYYLDQHMKRHEINQGGTQDCVSNSMDTDTPAEAMIENEEEGDFEGEAVLKCHIRGCQFETNRGGEALLQIHMKKAHCATGQYKCGTCPCKFLLSRDLVRHVKEHHRKNQNSEEQDESTPTQDDLEMDMDVQETIRSVEEGIESENEDSSNLSGDSGPFKCKFCGITTTNKGGYVTHLNAAHAAKNPHKCKICPCRFRTPVALKNHMAKQHTHIQPNLKKRKIAHKSQLALFDKLHKRLYSATSNNKTKATISNKQVRELNPATNLKVSLPSTEETKKAQVRCPICSQLIYNESGLKWHMIRKHKDPGTKPQQTVSTASSVQTESNASDSTLNKIQDKVSQLPDSSPTKAARKYAEVEGPDDLQETDGEDNDLFEKIETPVTKVKKTTSRRGGSRVRNSSTLEVKLKCSKCDYSNRASLVKQHEARAHVEGGVKCPFCPCTFEGKGNSINRHVFLAHKKRQRNSGYKALGRGQPKLVKEVLKTKTSRRTSNIGESEQSEALQNHAPEDKEPDTDVFKCSMCPFQTNEKSNHSAHMKIQHSLLHTCYKCKKTFTILAELKSHFSDDHPEEGYHKDSNAGQESDGEGVALYKCESESDNEYVDLEEDIRAQSNPATPNKSEFSCNQCDFCTHLRIKLKEHQRKAHGTPQKHVEKVVEVDKEGEFHEIVEEIETKREISSPVPFNKSSSQNDEEEVEVVSSTKKQRRSCKNDDGEQMTMKKPRLEYSSLEEVENNSPDTTTTTQNALSPVDEVQMVWNGLGQRRKKKGRSEGYREFMKFSCCQCMEPFDTVKDMTIHIQTCEAEHADFTCNLCSPSKNHSSLRNLKEHLWKRHLTNQERHRCELEKQENIHVQENQLPYSCNLCNVHMRGRQDFIYHLAVPHLFRCNKCSFVTRTKLGLRKHKEEQHGSKRKTVEKSKDVDVVFEGPSSSTDSVKETMKAHSSKLSDDLPTSTTSEPELSETCIDEKDKDKDVMEAKTDADESQMEIEEDSLICDKCGTFFETAEEAREHKETSTSVGSLVCHICAEISVSQCDAIIHTKSHVGEERSTDDTEMQELDFISLELDWTYAETEESNSSPVNGDNGSMSAQDNQQTPQFPE